MLGFLIRMPDFSSSLFSNQDEMKPEEKEGIMNRREEKEGHPFGLHPHPHIHLHTYARTHTPGP
jgi:hypothetical protein